MVTPHQTTAPIIFSSSAQHVASFLAQSLAVVISC